ncbi:MAG: hypothetical protein V7720_18425 [Halioglobus sp.]
MKQWIVLPVLLVSLAGCKINQHVAQGGNLESESGMNNCPEAVSCVVDVEDGAPFKETFTAVPGLGYVFAGWGKGLCADSAEPCSLDLGPDFTSYDTEVDLNARFERFESAHMIQPGYSVGAVNGFDLTFLNYSWRWTDVVGNIDSGSLAMFGSGCSVSASVMTPPLQGNEGVVGSGDCDDTFELGLSTAGRTGFVIPERRVQGVDFSAVDIGVDFSYLSQSANAFSTSVSTVTTNNTANGVATEGYFQTFYAKKSTDANIARLAGDWAVTRLEIEVAPTFEALYTVLTFPAEIVTEGGGALTVNEQAELIESEFKHYFDGSPARKSRFETTSGEAFSAPLTLTPQGELNLNAGDRDQPGRNPQISAGFIAPSHDFFVLAEGVPGIFSLRDGNPDLPSLDEFSAHQVLVGIKRNDTPELEGKKYRLVGVKFDVDNNVFSISPWSEDASLVFSANMEGKWKMSQKGKEVAFANSDQQGITSTESSDQLRFSYTVDPDGRIFFDMSRLAGLEQALVNGYASLDSEVLVFSHAISLNDATNGEIGMWLGLCTNCD